MTRVRVIQLRATRWRVRRFVYEQHSSGWLVGEWNEAAMARIRAVQSWVARRRGSPRRRGDDSDTSSSAPSSVLARGAWRRELVYE